MNADRIIRTVAVGPILVTGAAGKSGAVGRTVSELLLERRLPVRALVRKEDERAAADALKRLYYTD